jgi:hypothetical protein
VGGRIVEVRGDLAVEPMTAQYVLPVTAADDAGTILIPCVLGDRWIRRAVGMAPADLQRLAIEAEAEDPDVAMEASRLLASCVERVSSELEQLGRRYLLLSDEEVPEGGGERRICIHDVIS